MGNVKLRKIVLLSEEVQAGGGRCDALKVRIPDAPKPHETVLVGAVANGGRPHPRVGGLTKEEAVEEDGLR